MNNFFTPGCAARALLTALLFAAALAQAGDSLKVTDAWTQASLPGQKVAGVYMKLESDRTVRVTGAKTPVASSAELHVMRMEAGVMTMRRVPYLELAPGKPVTLEPGGYHLMLFGVKVPLKAGEIVPVTLEIAETGQVRRIHKVVLYAQVRPAGTEPAKPARR
jgi:copper(I)-binding protein